MDSTIIVSVLCLAYNHEKYIRDCLDGFVRQKTTFPFEVLINDDASTDGTASIIREYEIKYPGIIKGIYQQENQYSKGIGIVSDILFPKASGKYIAFCEGDDYWSSEDKLQKQFDALESHPECHLAVHANEVIRENGQTTGNIRLRIDIKNNIISSSDFIYNVLFKEGPHLASFFIRSKDYQQYCQNLPTYRKCVNFGDIPMALFFGNLGSVFYSREVMSKYRLFSDGSWSSKLKASSKEKQIEHFIIVKKMILEFDKCTDYKYHDWCNLKVIFADFHIEFVNENYIELLSKKYRPVFAQISIKRKLGIIFRMIKKLF